jgi:hypothetical protein
MLHDVLQRVTSVKYSGYILFLILPLGNVIDIAALLLMKAPVVMSK